MTNRGYQVTEPPKLDAISAWPKHQVFAVAILHWLSGQLQSKLADQLSGAEIDVICVCYFGCYPALGIHYPNDNPKDLGPLVESTADQLLVDTPLIDLVRFIAESNLDWNDVTAKLMKSGELKPTGGDPV